ncbi:bifunctional UDP-N-acetylglucosamine diphosphorylase/glucosamine-1-phosphate N-acetyltransferase GlmU [Catenovulum sp. SM1970]|uniref:bifunctional UDP-N-acetylglucosamine diphosphorylase/glucosamine-1-phosphate N-acetyltransferase GlmU n=1 Tax=Marinifaba aquimaris TaxID=2741323 RepID=UPI001572A76D|nr:bifunctional UDP-N-acetylglucosamine diphosphorylase/glucosamine-1-phosphate N-acetyltransferase GlmU [Marinifaba aquimaris]NTS76230.1 bifunctional UDP-N-acetylglucosamine diphosphorylase/glucosamine-1-phosphate N-acetyltransferase GlmU [Marinifaba aquimaris]
MEKLSAVILAAGKGTRMKSNLPKVLHKIGHKPMVKHVMDASRQLGAQHLHLIYGHGGEQLKAALASEQANWVEQAEQLGTGHAVQQVIPFLADDETVLILYGDVPLIKTETLEKLVAATPADGIGLLTVVLDNPFGYGRIVRDENGLVKAIVEQKDANEAEQAIREINTGILAANGKQLKAWLGNLNNDNAQQEYYLTDIIEMCANEGKLINTVHPNDADEVEGVNNRMQQAHLERVYQLEQAHALMVEGVTLRDASRLDVRGDVKVGKDVVLDVNVILEGEVELADNVTIEANCILKNVKVGAGTTIKANSHLEEAVVGSNNAIGPYARLRPGAELSAGCHVGNFVEIKKSTLGEGAKANHLTYLGNATVGAGTNIGAGTITCNYDGVNKFETHIGDNCFIGSNSALVAPVSVKAGATVGAGAVVTRDVEENELAVARAKQRNIQGWERPVKK